MSWQLAIVIVCCVETAVAPEMLYSALIPLAKPMRICVPAGALLVHVPPV